MGDCHLHIGNMINMINPRILGFSMVFLQTFRYQTHITPWAQLGGSPPAQGWIGCGAISGHGRWIAGRAPRSWWRRRVPWPQQSGRIQKPRLFWGEQKKGMIRIRGTISNSKWSIYIYYKWSKWNHWFYPWLSMNSPSLPGEFMVPLLLEQLG